MKGEHHTTTVEEAKQHANMFTNLHLQHQLHHHPHHQQQHHHHHHQQLSRECLSTPDEDESRSSGGGGSSTKKSKIIEGSSSGGGVGGGSGGDGATIEVVRRPRGRPPGSKNKPKPPVIITRDSECPMRPHVLEVPAGVDIVEAIVRFARHRNVGLCVLSGTGAVANVSLRQPSTTPGATVTFHGRFDILSISATYLPPPSSPSSSSSSSLAPNAFAISLAGPQGQIFGGSVIGTLIAASTVFIVATTFSSPSYHRLPIEEEGPNSVTGDGATQPPSSSDGEDQRAPPPQQTESCGMSIYSGHLSSDVIWVPTARQPPPPHF